MSIVDGEITFDAYDALPAVDLPPLVAGSAAVVAAGDAIRAYAGWHIFPVITESVTIDGSGASALILPTLKVQEIDSVVEDGVELVDTDYELSVHAWLRKHCWTSRLSGVQVVMSHGFTVLPLDLEQLVNRIAVDGFASVKSEAAGPFSRSFGDDGVSWTSVMNKYRLPARS